MSCGKPCSQKAHCHLNWTLAVGGCAMTRGWRTRSFVKLFRGISECRENIWLDLRKLSCFLSKCRKTTLVRQVNPPNREKFEQPQRHVRTRQDPRGEEYKRQEHGSSWKPKTDDPQETSFFFGYRLSVPWPPWGLTPKLRRTN